MQGAETVYHVIVLGGGPAGCATALALLKHSDASFLVVDNADPSAFKVGESLPPESSSLLRHLHPSILPRLASGHHSPCTGNASAWATPLLEERHAIFNPFGHGLHLDRAAFDEMLRQVVIDGSPRGASASTLIKGTFKHAEKNSSSHWSVHVDVNGISSTFFSRWLVDATGRKASVSTKLGAKTISSEPLLSFYTLYLGPSPDDTPDADTDHRTVIEATPEGWFYTALLPRLTSESAPSTRLVSFHTYPTHPSARQARRSEGFLQAVHWSTTHISGLLNKHAYEPIRQSSGFPRCTAAGSSRLVPPCDLVDEGWVAVGDAALAFDPLSSQGMMTALEMGCYVGMALARLFNDQQDGLEESSARTRAQVAVEGMYESVWEQYERHREYYYRLVKRFEGEEFWSAVQKPISVESSPPM
ncbi:hypothetical protein F5148DRAFT_374642 [Russula earlei]|uniref:Uncharacterized protein n=1 Tax=Russula earlei TaxID=71964 RepID=A0ACC0UI84_9AGAM|nr:hypothetical protein F5148DRAFT_374642 [Russula earlei]